MKKTSVILFVLLSLSSAAIAQSVYTPERGSKERTAILDALRAPVERDLKQKIQFAIDHFKVQGSWAFLNGEPQNTSGGTPDYSKTKYRDEFEAGVFDNNFQVLLKKTAGKWKVITYAIGCTDVCYATWWKDYKAPKAIFPYTE